MTDITLLRMVYARLKQGDNYYESLEPKEQDYLDTNQMIYALEHAIDSLILNAFEKPEEAYKILREWPYDPDGYCELGGKDYWFKDIDEACEALITERGWQ